MSTNELKVYCGQCRWYRYQGSWSPVGSEITIDAHEVCNHVRNTKWANSHVKSFRTIAWTPTDKNAGNDCPLYSERSMRKPMWARIRDFMTVIDPDRKRDNL